MNYNNSASRLSMIIQGLAHNLPIMLPPIIICAIGFTFALMAQKKFPKAAKLTKIGCILLGLSPVYSTALKFYSLHFFYEGPMRFFYSLILGAPSYIGIICIVIAAFADRPSGIDNTSPDIR